MHADRWPTKLLSIDEKHDGDLIIHDERGPIIAEIGSRPLLIDDHKFSVHRPDNKPNDTMTKHTVNYSGKTAKQTSVSWIHETTDNLLWPIYGRRPPNPLQQERTVQVIKDDVNVFIMPYDPRQWTLMFSVFVTHVGLDLDIALEDLKMAFLTDGEKTVIAHKHSFRCFNIYLLASWIMMPTIYPGFTRPISRVRLD